MSNMSEINQQVQGQYKEERYIQFDLGLEKYAVPLLTVKEVIPVPETTPIPNSANYYNGIMNLRGQIISIVDLRKKLKITPSENKKEEAVIIVEVQAMSIGLVVDSINRVLNIKSSDVSEIPEVGSQINAKFIQGVYRSEECLTVLVDLESILDLKQIKKQMAA